MVAERAVEEGGAAAQPRKRRVGLRELKERTSAVVRQVEENGEPVDITRHGEVVARIVPVDVSAPVDDLSDEAIREERRRRFKALVERSWVGGEPAPRGGPWTEADREAVRRRWQERLALGREIAAAAPEPFSAVELIREIRDDRWYSSTRASG